MRNSVKKQLVEMVEYVEFPIGIYIYETGKLIAANKKAKEVLNGTSCQNVNLLWADHKKLKLEPEVLRGKSKIYLNRAVEVGDEVLTVDFEINVFQVLSEHIVVAFFDRSFRQSFRLDMLKHVPGMIWMDANGEYTAKNRSVQYGLERFLYVREHIEEASEKELQMLENIKKEHQKIRTELQPIFCKIVQVDFDEDNSGLVSMNKVPFLSKGEEYAGTLMICNPVFSQADYDELLGNARFENVLLRECVMADNKIVLGIHSKDDGVIRYATDNIKLLGYEQEELLQRKLKWKDVIYPEDRKRVMDEIKEAIENGDRFIKQKYRVRTVDGKIQWVDTLMMGNDLSVKGELWHIVVHLDLDVSVMPIMKNSQKVNQEPYLDFLTGLPNRIKYEEDAKKQIEAALMARKKGYVIALDLDDFKHINEGLGPEYGDILLKKIAILLNDIPEVENYCYRVDGDEFLLFVRGEYAKSVENIIQQCLELFHSNWNLDDKECFCSVSIGIAEYPKDSAQARELLKCADAAVYEAKRKGKNRIQHYKKAVLNSSVERVNYEKHLRKAISSGCVEFEMFFQPVVTTQTKELVSAEALVRWYSPELGFITPINFISLSEYLGLIVPLGEYVLRQTFLTCKKWNEEVNPDFKVSVNLSVVQLVQPNIVDRILEIARNTGVNTKNIILEVTESLAVEDMELMKSVLTQLRASGFSIALDDFGTGYSSINHIMEMPLNYVKIDKSFVKNYGTDAFNPRLLSATVELAHSVNTEVIVEGVETKQQMEFLMFLNADKIQGYLYGKPMPASEFEKKFFGGK